MNTRTSMNTKNNGAREKITGPDKQNAGPDKKFPAAHEKGKRLTQRIRDWLADFTEWDGSILDTLMARLLGHKYYLPFYQRRFPPNANPIQVSAYIFRSRKDLEAYREQLAANATFRFVCYSTFRSRLKIRMQDGAFGDKVLVSLFADIIRRYKVPAKITPDEKPD